MEYKAPYGSSDPDAPYVDRNTPGAVSGSKVPAPAIEHPQREMANLIALCGLTPSDGDLEQVARAVRSQHLNFIATVGGTANALTAGLNPAISSYAEIVGAPLRVMIAATNSGAATLDVGPGALPILTMKGAAVVRGDLPAGGIVTLICTGTAWLLAGVAYSEMLVPIVAPVVYVRTDGNDGNDGLANTSGSALATITEAVNRLRRFTLTVVAGQILLGNPGTYTGPGDVGVNGAISIIGDVADPASYIIVDNPTAVAVFNGTGGRVNVIGCTVRGTTAGRSVISANDTGYVNTSQSRLEFSVAGGAFHCSAAYGGVIALGNGVNIRGASDTALRSSTAGKIILSGAITYSNSAAFTINAYASAGGLISLTSGGSITGSATGQRYAAVSNAVISVGGGASFFPGSTAGTTATGGQYV